MRYFLLLVFTLSFVVLLAYTVRLEASEPARYTTEEVCDNPAGCKFVEDKCIGCVTKETHGPAPIINNNTTNNYNKTEIHNHNYTKETVIKETVKEVPVTTELVVKHEYVTVTEPVERLRPYISVNDNDKISILGAKHLGNNVWTFNMKVRGKHSKCSGPQISPIFTGGSASCANEFFHYSIDWE
jgi:hypothetical protein